MARTVRDAAILLGALAEADSSDAASRGYKGLSDYTKSLRPDALKGVTERSPTRIVYVSCDVATLARDARRLADAGYSLQEVTGFDLFPNTAHVESVAVFAR